MLRHDPLPFCDQCGEPIFSGETRLLMPECEHIFCLYCADAASYFYDVEEGECPLCSEEYHDPGADKSVGSVLPSILG